MGRKVDVVVVGAGLGGLSAATSLARKGLSVVLLERHVVPGGCATSFQRGRFEFEVALHELSGIGTPERPGPLRRYLDSLGVTDHVSFSQVPTVYRAVFPDVDVTVPVGKEAAETALCEAFPGEADGIHRFLGRLWEFARQLGNAQRLFPRGQPDWKRLATLPANVDQLLRYAMSSYEDVLRRDVRDVRAQAVLGQPWGYLGLPPSKLAYTYMAAMMTTFIKGGVAYVEGRSQALSSAFVRALEDHGGEARMRTGVKRITVRDGRVTGVITDADEHIEADYVISSADPVTTCSELIDADEVPDRFWRRLRPARPAASSFNVYLGVARSPDELGLDDHEVFLNTHYDADEAYRKMQGVVAPDLLALTAYNRAYPAISPPGTSIVVLTTLQYGEPWHAIAPDDYVETKTRIADAMLTRADAMYPGLREYAEVVEVSTPVTNMRYTGTLGGSIYGFDHTPEHTAVLRQSNKGPLGGLYFSSVWAWPGGGMEPAIGAGQIAAGMVSTAAGLRRRKGA